MKRCQTLPNTLFPFELGSALTTPDPVPGKAAPAVSSSSNVKPRTPTLIPIPLPLLKKRKRTVPFHSRCGRPPIPPISITTVEALSPLRLHPQRYSCQKFWPPCVPSQLSSRLQHPTLLIDFATGDEEWNEPSKLYRDGLRTSFQFSKCCNILLSGIKNSPTCQRIKTILQA